jgi:hypothetical protein
MLAAKLGDLVRGPRALGNRARPVLPTVTDKGQRRPRPSCSGVMERLRAPQHLHGSLHVDDPRVRGLDRGRSGYNPAMGSQGIGNRRRGKWTAQKVIDDLRAFYLETGCAGARTEGFVGPKSYCKWGLARLISSLVLSLPHLTSRW